MPVSKSCMVICGLRHNKECVDILLNGVPSMLFEVGRKPKVSLAAKRSMKFSGFQLHL